MSYCIMTIIYGVPLTEEIHKKIEEWEDDGTDEWGEDAESCGFETTYTAHARPSPGWCGIELGGFTECDDAIPISKLQLEPTPEQRVEAEARVAALHPEIRAICQPIGVYIIPSSS